LTIKNNRFESEELTKIIDNYTLLEGLVTSGLMMPRYEKSLTNSTYQLTNVRKFIDRIGRNERVKKIEQRALIEIQSYSCEAFIEK